MKRRRHGGGEKRMRRRQNHENVLEKKDKSQAKRKTIFDMKSHEFA